MPEISSQPLGQSLLQLYSNSLQPSPTTTPPAFEQTRPSPGGPGSRPGKRQSVQRQIHAAQQETIKQLQAQQQAVQPPVISLPSFSNESRPRTSTAGSSKSGGRTIPSSPITPASTTPNPPGEGTSSGSAALPTSLASGNLATFSEYTSELNDVLQVGQRAISRIFPYLLGVRYILLI